jgi:hypothetical protein
MTVPAERRANWLLRCYPRQWRDRYGDELCALLEDELNDGRSPFRTTLNVVVSGLVARAGTVGLAGPVDARTQGRSSMAWIAGSTCAFLAFALTMWTQMIVGWQWTPPHTVGTTSAVVVMSVAAYVLMACGLLAGVPVIAAAGYQALRRSGAKLRLPLAIAAVSAAVLVVGARRFENGWPGTGGHHWAFQGLVPGGLAAFVWAVTMAVTSYWAHPGTLRGFPAAEVAWMAVSASALAAGSVSISVAVRRVALGRRFVRYELRVAQAASVAMATFLVGAVLWFADGQARPRSVPDNLFHVGAIDVVGAVVMTAALLVAHHALHRGLTSVDRVAR